MSSSVTPLLDFKSATVYAVRLVLQPAQPSVLLAALQQRLAESGDFFEGEPVVIDAQALAAPADWSALAKVLRAHGMAVVGVAAPEGLHAGIQSAGLATVSLPPSREAAGSPFISEGSVHRDPPQAQVPQAAPSVAPPTPEPSQAVAEIVSQAGLADQAATSAPPDNPEHPRPTLLLDRSLRSGQKVYARGADLIVIGMVSPGAEVIADGHIHVYGPLRGKAMAGARGDENARIFTTRLDAELVAVAGVYRVVDTELPADLKERAAEVRLQAGALRINPLAV